MATGNPCTVGRIVNAAVVTRHVPLKRALRGTRGPITTRSLRLLVLLADDGVRGLGDASRVDWLSVTMPDDDDALASLIERIRSDAPPAAALLQWSLDPARPCTLRCALQTALLDADARREGLGMAALLCTSAPATRAPVSALLGDDKPDAMAREASKLRALGLDTFKVKVGRRALDDDIAVVAAVRGAIGVHATLRLDANGAWSTDEAKTALRELAHFAPKFVEEPLREASLCGQFSSPVPIALDESLPDVVALEAAIARGGLAAVVLKLERVGGPLPALAMAARAWRAGLEVAFTDSIDGECGRAAVVHTAVAASARSGRPLAALGLGGLFLLDDGSTAVPIVDVGAPGLAVTLPTDFVAAAS